MARLDPCSVSLSRGTYNRLRDHADRSGLSMAEIVTAIVDSLDPPAPVAADRCVLTDGCEAQS